MTGWQFFIGWMLLLMPNQQYQGTDGKTDIIHFIHTVSLVVSTNCHAADICTANDWLAQQGRQFIYMQSELWRNAGQVHFSCRRLY